MKQFLYLIITLFSFSWAGYSQINGNIADDKSLPLPGANVTAGTVTVAADFEGNFSIDVPPGTMLTFSMIGYKDVTMAAIDGMKVTMKEDTNELNEVVVIGYGTKKAGSITGAVAQLKAADIVKTPSQSAIQAIQGRAAGVNIVASDEPGAQPNNSHSGHRDHTCRP